MNRISISILCPIIQFRTTSQNESETIEQYIVGLRQKAETYDFGDANDIDIQIRDQIVEKM